MSVEIRLSSEAAQVLTEPAEEFLRTAAKTEPVRSTVSQEKSASKGDPVAVAALILSIPSAILAAMDLVERAGLAKRIRKLLEKARKTDGTATLHVGTEPVLDLKSATEDEVIDLITKSSHP